VLALDPLKHRVEHNGKPNLLNDSYSALTNERINSKDAMVPQDGQRTIEGEAASVIGAVLVVGMRSGALHSRHGTVVAVEVEVLLPLWADKEAVWTDAVAPRIRAADCASCDAGSSTTPRRRRDSKNTAASRGIGLGV
jgi:hypothetical protein